MADKRKLITAIREIKLALDSKDYYAVRFIPDGADDPIPPAPTGVALDIDDADEAADFWDEIMPEYAGMLRARIKNSNRPGLPR
jgi:hypothetical protein